MCQEYFLTHLCERGLVELPESLVGYSPPGKDIALDGAVGKMLLQCLGLAPIGQDVNGACYSTLMERYDRFCPLHAMRALIKDSSHFGVG